MSEPHVVTDRSEFRSIAADAPSGARVPIEFRQTVSDPFTAYRRARTGPGGVFLETTGGQAGWGYFATEPYDTLTVSADAAVRERHADTDATGDYRRETPSLSALEGFLSNETIVTDSCPVPYPCGAIGWLSYDIARELETLPETAVDDRSIPRLKLSKYDCLAAWHTDDIGEETLVRITVCPQISDTADKTSALDDIYDQACERALAFADRMHTGDPAVGSPPVETDTATFESDCGRAAFADRVRQVKQYIRDGDTFQANISQRLVAPAAVHPVEAYDALRRVNPSPYSALIEFSGRAHGTGGKRWSGVDLVSASPELLIERIDDRIVTEPIAGTRPRGKTPEEDAALADDLTTDEKERAEHAMLVDLERNDLGKICAYGTVDVSEYRRVDRYSEVMHLVSVVDGTLRDDVSLADAIAATFPGGTITGAPKPRTMEIIDEMEDTQRGPYTGGVGVFGFDGNATLNIVIRTLTRHESKYHLRVGAGIVHDSIPDAEYDETLAKAKALITAIDTALTDHQFAIKEASQ